MRVNTKNSKAALLVLVLALLVGGIRFFGTSMSAQASQKDLTNPGFAIEAELQASGEDTYNICLNVKNLGADWEGTVRLMVSEGYYVPSAYDTALSLPQGSEKQFVVKVPRGATENTDGSVRVLLLDKQEEIVADETFKRFLFEEMDSISMGILSDDYPSLTYLDMGGTSLYYYNDSLPIKLVELTQDKLVDTLESLAILVIDKYNTDVLTDEELKAVALWIDNGGVMIVGTGGYAEDTLGGLEDILPKIKSTGVISANSDGDAASLYGEWLLDVSRLDMAELQADMNQYYEGYVSYGILVALGDGAVGVVPYSLVDLGKVSESAFVDITQENYVQNMLEEITGTARARYSKTNSVDNFYERMSLTRRMLGILGNNNSVLHFGALKFLVIAYVIFVGPILYLILRFIKKREWYWITVPVTALVGIVVVFFAGRGFEVVSTRVYSVTAQSLSSKESSRTYLYCYDAEYDEWSLQLSEGYEYVGALLNENYSYRRDDDLAYRHHIRREGDTLSFGMKPSSAFEDSFFYAGKSKEGIVPVGSITCTNMYADWGNITGEIVNDTEKDFAYYAVIVNDMVCVYKDLPAGGRVSLENQTLIYNSSQGYSMRSDYIYDFLNDVYRNKADEDMGALAALGVGIHEAYPQTDANAVVICGVTTDWDKAVNDDCSEVSYGCLYTVQ